MMEELKSQIIQIKEIYKKEEWTDGDVKLLFLFITSNEPILSFLAVNGLSQHQATKLLLENETEVWDCCAHRSKFINQIHEKHPLIMSSIGILNLIHSGSRKKCCCDKHCCCSNWQTLCSWIKLKGSETTIKELRKIVEYLCIQPKSCCLQKILTFLRHYIQETKDNETVEGILSLVKPLLSTKGTNFVGEVIPKEISPSFLLFLNTWLDVIKIYESQPLIAKGIESLMRNIREILSDEVKELKNLLKFLVDEDDKLIEFSETVILILIDSGDFVAMHQFMEEFLRSCNFDSQLLLDWMTSDEETSLPLLRLLLQYLKQDNQDMASNTKETLFSLYSKLKKLQDKNLIPFDSKPLIHLLQEKCTQD